MFKNIYIFDPGNEKNRGYEIKIDKKTEYTAKK